MTRARHDEPSLAARRLGAGRAHVWVLASWCAAALVLALAAWWSRPRAARTAAPLVALVVDVSASAMAPAGARWSEDVRATAARVATDAAAAGADLCVVSCGRDVRIVMPSAPAAQAQTRFEAADFDARRAFAHDVGPRGDDASALAAALELASSQAADGAVARVVLCSDGTWTGSDPARVLARLAAQGTRLEWAPPRRERGDLAVGALVCPRRLEVGAPLVVEVLVRYAPPDAPTARRARARLVVERRDARAIATDAVRDASSVTVHEREFDVDADLDAGLVRSFVDVGPTVDGLTTLDARVRFAADGVVDALPENDGATARVRSAGARVVGVLVEPGSDARRAAPAWVIAARSSGALAGLTWIDVATAELPAAWSVLDALVTSDLVARAAGAPEAVPRDETSARLAPTEIDALGAFLRRGGGWLDLPGDEWIARRAAADDALSALAALRPDPAGLKPREVVFLIDASGSMAGAPFDEVRAGLAELVDAALPSDDLVVRFFSDDVEPAVRLDATDRRSPAARRAFVEALARAREPHGATRLWRATEALVERAPDDGRERLVLLLSDGGEPDRADVTSRARALRERCAATRTRLVAAAPRDGADTEFLRALTDDVAPLAARGADGRPHWDAVFRREIARSGVRRAPDARVHAASAPGELARPLARVDGALPPTDESVRAVAVDGADVFWTAEDGAPLGALARRGRGIAATLAFAPGTAMAPRWNDPAPLAPLVRLLARGRDDGADGPRVRLDDAGARCEVVVEGLPADTPAALDARVEDGSGSVFDVRLAPDERARDPRTARRAPLPDGFRGGDGSARVVIATATGSWPLALDASPVGEFAAIPRRARLPAPQGDLRADGAGRSDAPRAASPARARAALALGLGLVALGGWAWFVARGRGGRSRTRA